MLDAVVIVEISSECSGLAQRGGLGSVIWGLCDQFVRAGHETILVMPFYPEISAAVEQLRTFAVEFGGKKYPVTLFYRQHFGIQLYLIHNDTFFRGEYGDVYIDSRRLQRGHFEDDAKRFAFFSRAACDFLLQLAAEKNINAVHCHDWHTAFVLFLMKKHPRYAELCTLRTLFTIHNLEYQGTRPFAAMGELRGFLDWFPELAAMPHDHFTAGFDLYADIPCINPMRMAINLADFVTTVSPSYAEEICHADDPARDFFGGRGLEKDLERLHREGRLTGITNGIDLAFYDPQKLPLCYSAQNRSKGLKKNRKALYADLPELIPQLAESGMLYGECVPTLRQKIQKIKARDFYELPLLVVVSRMTGQKIRQFFAEVDGKTPLEHLATEKLFVVFLGKGDLLQALMRETASLPNILLFAGFDDMLEKRLLAAGDLFLMPSEFEPCGTSQMKAMRYGCLPVAHAVGGLKDTIRDGETGFLYTGNSLIEKAKAFWATIQKALALRAHRPKEFERMQENAMRSDFSWHGPALRYLELMQ